MGTFDPRGYRWPTSVPQEFRSGLVCHNDVNLDNVIFRRGEAVGLIDFDLGSPGRRSGTSRWWPGSGCRSAIPSTCTMTGQAEPMNGCGYWRTPTVSPTGTAPPPHSGPADVHLVLRHRPHRCGAGPWIPRLLDHRNPTARRARITMARRKQRIAPQRTRHQGVISAPPRATPQSYAPRSTTSRVSTVHPGRASRSAAALW